MSAFLGPIHYWLYNKITLQNSMVEKVISFAEEKYTDLDLRNSLEQEFGSLEAKPLEEMIDTSNIHGWLQEKVFVVEYRMAYAVTAVLKQEFQALDKLKEIFFNFGADHAITAEGTELKAADIFKDLNDTLLDGMPCDHANAIVSETEDEVVWKRNLCVHGDFWDEAGGDIKNYYILREAFIKGYISKTGAVFEKLDETTSRLSIKK